MAWNPTKEVAIARDASKQLGDAQMVIVLWVTNDGKQLGVASYGKTKALCADAKIIADSVYDHVMANW